VRHNPVRRVNELAKRGLLLDDARVVLDVGGARDAVGQRGDVGGPANFIELTRARELLLQRDEIDRLSALVERHHPVEDAPVRVAIETSRVDDLSGHVERVVVYQDGAEHGTFGIEIVRKRTLRGSNDSFGHEEESRRTCGASSVTKISTQ